MDPHGASVDHELSYIFWKLWPTPFQLGLQKSLRIVQPLRIMQDFVNSFLFKYHLFNGILTWVRAIFAKIIIGDTQKCCHFLLNSLSCPPVKHFCGGKRGFTSMGLPVDSIDAPWIPHVKGSFVQTFGFSNVLLLAASFLGNSGNQIPTFENVWRKWILCTGVKSWKQDIWGLASQSPLGGDYGSCSPPN